MRLCCFYTYELKEDSMSKSMSTAAHTRSLLAVAAVVFVAACESVTKPPDPNDVAQPLFSHSASEQTGTFLWVFGTNFIPAFGPAVSLAKDGSRIEISGIGTFSIGEGPPSVGTISGTFAIFDSPIDGNLVASGNWTMERLRGYVDYGGIPGAPVLRGGTLTAEIDLDGLGKGSLWIFCLNGTPPPSKEEGVHVKIGSWHFDDITGAVLPVSPTIFVRT